MGFYINPTDMSKEDWIANNATDLLIRTPESLPTSPDEILVCIVDNGPFTAAAFVYDQRELEAFSLLSDRRPKAWYVVPRDRALAVCPDLERVLS